MKEEEKDLVVQSVKYSIIGDKGLDLSFTLFEAPIERIFIKKEGNGYNSESIELTRQEFEKMLEIYDEITI